MFLRRGAAIVAGVGLLLLGGSAAADTGSPPGATARCKDGTYSYSQHHSGTCSHHGGVAQWLDVSNSSGAGSAAPAPGSVPVGRTVVLRPRMRASGCTPGPRPDRRCSPGAFSSGLTKAVICSSTFRTSSVRHVTTAMRHQVEIEYGMAPRAYGSTLEIDHIVSLELGGSNDISNLFPEKAPGFHVKDRLENRLHALVCSGAMTLHAAQAGIAANWQALYARVFDSRT